MPYVRPSLRRGLDERTYTPDNSGELNYVLTREIIRYCEWHGLNYGVINDISGAFTECLAEFNRRIVGPYEDAKIRENGDVFTVVPRDTAGLSQRIISGL